MFALDSVVRPLVSIFRTARERAGAGKPRWLLPVVAGLVPIGTYLAVAVMIGLVLLTAEGGRFSLAAVLIAAVPGWLAAHQVPVSFGGAELAVLPLLPTGLVLLWIGAASSLVARRAGLQRPDQAAPVICAMGCSHVFFGGLAALVLRGSVEAPVLDALVGCGVLAGVASAGGMSRRCGLIGLVRERIAAEIRSAARVSLIALAGIATAGALVTLAGICLSFFEMRDMLARTGSVGDAFGVTLLSILYLPNAVLAGWSFAVGTGVSIGELTVQPWHVAPGPIPELPLLAALPSEGPAVWWMLGFAAPLLVGAMVGRACWSRSSNPVRRFGVLGLSSLVVALGTLVLAGVSGGSAGGGPFDPVTLRPVTLALVTFAWIGGPAAVVMCSVGAGETVRVVPREDTVPAANHPDDRLPGEEADQAGDPVSYEAEMDEIDFSEETEALVAELEKIDLSDLDGDRSELE